jgi:hypothetical protein
VLHRALRALPIGLLQPLLRGVRRHADSLVPGSLYTGDGGCAVGMMLRELAPQRRRRRNRTIWDEWPELVQAHPRLAHIEVVFDRTCKALYARGELSEEQTARNVGLWMAAEIQAEINLRHLEDHLPEGRAAARAAPADPGLFSDTVARLRELRPWLTEEQAARAVEEWTAAPRLEPEPLFVPREWEQEVELQRLRLAGPSEALPA